MSSVFIHNAASITAQGFDDSLVITHELAVPENYDAKEPSYKDVLPSNMVRRMAKITRMALMCALQISDKDNPEQWDGIIAATGLGNLGDTERFINTYVRSQGGLIPPTSFTQSSHNTIAGQIALILKNHNYNVAHVQQSFSFENGLKDAELQFKTGKKNILVGAADEKIGLLNTIGTQLSVDDELLASMGEGASFFHLSSDSSSKVVLRAVELFYNCTNPEEVIHSFLAETGINRESVMMFSSTALNPQTLSGTISISNYCGRYFTNSAYAFHHAASVVAKGEQKHALVVNLDHKSNIALTLLSAV